MTKFLGSSRKLALVLALAGASVPALAQESSADTRLRRLEAEVRDLKRQAGAAGTIAPQATPRTTSPPIPGTPASTPVADLLARMDAIEGQLARLTAQNEESGHKLRLLEERVAANEATAKAVAPALTAAPAADPAAPTPASAAPAASAPPALAAATPASKPVAATRARPAAAAPSAQRVAAVRAVAKPQTNDTAEDEYTYGFRLWEAKFYPEAQQQLQLFLTKYPRHSRVSYARNLMGRALLDEGKPYEAAKWFVQNYEANKRGDRAPDSLLYLAVAMREHKDTNRACIALTEFQEVYPQEAAGRLKGVYDATRASVKCN